jgi:hypothetical protein
VTLHVFDRLARFALAFVALAGVTSCGSGAVSGPVPVNDPTRITILPATATLFSGTPTTFVISGGTGSYIVTSSNQSVIPISGSISAGRLTVVPNAVATDTPVTLTVRDSGTTPVATAALTVRPGTVNNELTITPTSTQGGGCAPAICSGSDAVVSARISQGGVPLPGREVRFDVVSGDFFFITSPPGQPETLATSITVVTDETGRVQARIRATATAPNQTALLQVTDVASGAFQRTPFVIAQATGSSPGFFVAPASITFTGPNVDECATGATANFYVFGGTPPYRVSNASSAFTVDREALSFSGDFFTVTSSGVCVVAPGLPIVVTDASGRTVTALVANVPGTRTVPPLVVSPTSVSLSSCLAVAGFTVAGGTGNYIATSGDSNVLVTPGPSNTFSVQRTSNTRATASPVTVSVSDGRSLVAVNVTLAGTALNSCPEFAASTRSVSLASCTAAATPSVTLRGGTGSYAAISSDPLVTATIGGPGANILTIRRAPGAGPVASPVTVTVSDGEAPNIGITVNVSGAAAGTCP